MKEICIIPVVVLVVVAPVVVFIDAVRKIFMRKLPYSQNILLIIGQIEKTGSSLVPKEKH